MALVPDHVRDQIIPRLYEEALEMRWESLPQRDRTRAYNQWSTRDDIGGVLVGYLGSPARVRSWLKDGPLKHFTDARAGAGPYARYLDAADALPARLSHACLGAPWQVVPESQRTKPLRFQARNDTGETATLIHGPARKFRDLAWAALNEAVRDRGPDRVVVVVVEQPGQPTPPADRKRQRRITDRCGIDIDWVELADD